MKLQEESNVAEVLKALREKKNLTRADLAAKINCSRDTVRKIEDGEHKPNYAIFCRWAKACGYQLTLQSIRTKKTPIPMTKTAEQSQTHSSGSLEEEN